MSLLLMPTRDPLEGPFGYRARLAQENMLSASAMRSLIDDGVVDEAAWWRDAEVRAPASFIRRWARFCPRCLPTAQRWRLGWELRFADACPTCGSWLVDTCPACGTRLTWGRRGLLICQECHGNLCGGDASPAPEALVRMSRGLEQCALGQATQAVPLFEGLTLAQSTQLVRLLGAYASWEGERVPQKILDADQLDVSWTISTAAAEVLGSWPQVFWRLLDRLGEQAEPTRRRRLGRALGGLYAALYRGLKAPAFDFVRDAFEEYVVQSWTGALGRRNRRLRESVLGRVTWLHPRAACREFGISARLLHRLADQGSIQAITRVSDSGRKFLMVRRDELTRWQAESAGFVTLAEAATQLGLKRQRLSRLLPLLCPEAIKSADQGAAWNIPRAWLRTWTSRLEALPAVCSPAPTELVAIDHILRYGALDARAVGRLFLAIQNGAIPLRGALDGSRRVSDALLAAANARGEIPGGKVADIADCLAIPEVARHLGVKQEVAYFLVRSGLLPAWSTRERGRLVQRVRHGDLLAFQDAYIFARDVARLTKTSPRSIAARFREAGIDPLSGPGIDGGRQLVYRRRDVQSLLSGVEALSA